MYFYIEIDRKLTGPLADMILVKEFEPYVRKIA